MRFTITSLAAAAFYLCCLVPCAKGDLPGPAAAMAPWSLSFDPAAPGAFSAAGLLDKPAGRLGPVVARDGHFFSGNQRVRFWGVNIAFSGCFPTHEQADAVAQRLSRFGINCVRLHHMDMQPYPNGIWADRKLETLSPEAIDRLDYFIAALKKEGVYSNINLHVSRWYSKAHNWPNADKLVEFDKLIDLFHPELIAIQKQYARDLLGHVNAYTKTRLADEPAVAIVEITNEDSMFFWGGEQRLASLPEPYAGIFTKLWNQWVGKKYPTRERLLAAWSAGVQPLGENFLRDGQFATLGKPGSAWTIEQHENAKMAVTVDRSNPTVPLAKLNVTVVSGTSWHLQFGQPGLALKKGQTYTLSFRTKADKPTKIDANVSQAHANWSNLGLSYTADVGKDLAEQQVSFIASEDDANGRISFGVGREVNTICLGDFKLRPGTPPALGDDEDAAKGSIARPIKGGFTSSQRNRDWYEFVQATDEAYFTDMHRFLKSDIGVKGCITGSIGLGPLGTLTQSKMDFVDAHSYWDHPQFPNRDWSATNWQINNKPMVDNPAGATLWGLAASRVAGKPFTVTEYNHAAPNEWQAECIPLIATYAALQDWDGVFLFAYSHNSAFFKDRISSYFDIEGNPLMMPFSPLAARIFLAQTIAPRPGQLTIHPTRSEMYDTGGRYYADAWGFLKGVHQATWQSAFGATLAVSFDGKAGDVPPAADKPDTRATWSGNGAGTGQFRFNDNRAAVFVGFTKGAASVEVGRFSIGIESPFVALMLIPADPTQTLDKAGRLLLAIAGRAENTGMQWDDRRRTLSNRWGRSPTRIEALKVGVSSGEPIRAYALTPAGARGQQTADVGSGRYVLPLWQTPTVWYELVREK